ncbi:VPLPA-CTERM sorting domain-containing protein [Methylomonas sp. SURF-1]|uniref:VPLPA-CTERM sorting domain-containing protein n=1 Tax=Methylomonas aurea TaxID=2952224 RepID=A0ABT1UNG3_9GAMM|nr:VPLPA-CTERM sorting domain-containing protein [Methylomonas sp. SURF-1]MCQ8183363.1 VPLPA-CTERM sorting domain-containing protein [Methylomonas sp. SURF-1]
MFNRKFLRQAVLLSALSANAGAAALDADGQWHPFDVDDTVSASAGLEWIDLDGNALSFDFTLTGSAILTIVDSGFAGDRFDVFNGNLLLGQTSAASNNYPDSLGLDFDAAFADNRYSRGVFLLGPGSYRISGLLSQSALDDSAGAINATVGAISLTAVPLPAAAWLYLAGTGLMGLTARRQSKSGV